MRSVVNNPKAKDSKVPVSLAASFPAEQSCIFQDKFYFNFCIQWSVDPRKSLRVEKHLGISPLVLAFRVQMTRKENKLSIVIQEDALTFSMDEDKH